MHFSQHPLQQLLLAGFALCFILSSPVYASGSYTLLPIDQQQFPASLEKLVFNGVPEQQKTASAASVNDFSSNCHYSRLICNKVAINRPFDFECQQLGNMDNIKPHLGEFAENNTALLGQQQRIHEMLDKLPQHSKSITYPDTNREKTVLSHLKTVSYSGIYHLKRGLTAFNNDVEKITIKAKRNQFSMKYRRFFD